MAEIFSEVSLFAIVITLLAYELGLWLQRKTKNPLCNPIVIAILVIIAFLKLTGIPNSQYQAGAKIFSWLLTPATVCLAIPLYEQVKILKNQMLAILAGTLAGTAASIVFIFAMGRALGLEEILTVSMLPKSITTALGLAVSQQMGGNTAITAACIIITGIWGSIIGSPLAKLLHITDEVAQGAAFGTSAHVIGTSRANQVSELCGAVSSLALVVAGIVTAVVCPLIF